MKFSKTFFGFKPGEVISQIESMENEHQQRIIALDSEIEKFRQNCKRLKKSEKSYKSD